MNFLGLLGWASGTEEEIFSLDDLVQRFDLERVHSGRRRLRQGTPRVAQRPVDTQAVRRGAGRACTAVPAGRPAEGTGRRASRSKIPNPEELRPLDPDGAREDAHAGSDRTACRLPVRRGSAGRAGPDRAQAVGRGHDRGGVEGRARDRSPRSARSASRRTSWRRRCASWPRSAAGSRATCSWPSVSPSPDAPRRRRSSTRSWHSGTNVRWSGSTALVNRSRISPPEALMRPGRSAWLAALAAISVLACTSSEPNAPAADADAGGDRHAEAGCHRQLHLWLRLAVGEPVTSRRRPCIGSDRRHLTGRRPSTPEPRSGSQRAAWHALGGRAACSW